MQFSYIKEKAELGKTLRMQFSVNLEKLYKIIIILAHATVFKNDFQMFACRFISISLAFLSKKIFNINMRHGAAPFLEKLASKKSFT